MKEGDKDKMTMAMADAALAGVMAYIDPLAGYVPYSQAIDAAIGANLYPVIQSKDIKALWASPMRAVAAAAGTLLIPGLLPYFDFQLGGAIGAAAGVFLSDMFF